ncbi:MAG TPA: AraC family transcriptional regulator [Planctomycetota bacterium]|nr:AraC family transcriptional regulator [Planctomycetota bacterium]
MESTHWLERISPCVRLNQPGAVPKTYTGHFRHRPNWIEPLRVIYDHQLLLISEGEFIVEVEGRRYPCSRGSYMIIPPAHWHVSWEAAGRFGHRHWSHFDWTHAGPYGETPIMTFHPEKPREALYRPAPAFIPQRVFHGTARRFERVMEIKERLFATANAAQAHTRRTSRALLLELLLELFDEDDSQSTVPPPELRLAEKVRDLLDSNLERHSSVRIEDLLEQTGYCYAHVCRVFKRRYGMPPLKYLHLLSISRAKLMLRDTDLPVTRIARRLAFSDPEYFSQVFRRNVGQSPTEYRRMMR